MANCRNLNKLEKNLKKFYKGFGFLGKSNTNLVEMGKYNKGKLNKGIRFYGLLNLLEMGDFRENNTLMSGLKRINDDIMPEYWDSGFISFHSHPIFFRYNTACIIQSKILKMPQFGCNKHTNSEYY